jgi:hypothetical protein
MWIESHEELGQHPKTKRLARTLQVSLPAAVGYLQFLWWWALKYAPSGNLSRYTPEDIADAICWEGDAQQAVDALVSSGFIDDGGDGTLTIHDWYEYAGRLIEQREQHRKRSQRARNAKNREQDEHVSVPCPNGARTAHERSEDVQAPCAHGARTERARAENVQGTCGATVPNLTVPNKTKDTTPLPPPAEGERECDVPKTEQQLQFEEFWRAYPKKVGKEAAWKAWKKIKPPAALLAKILTAIPEAIQSRQWRLENGRFIPNPATWLNQGRWDDELTPTTTGGERNDDDDRNGWIPPDEYDPEGAVGFHNALDRIGRDDDDRLDE